MEALEERVSELESMMMRVLYIQQKTEIEMQKLQREMREFKEAIQKDTENLKKEMKEGVEPYSVPSIQVRNHCVRHEHCESVIHRQFGHPTY